METEFQIFLMYIIAKKYVSTVWHSLRKELPKFSSGRVKIEQRRIHEYMLTSL